MSDPSQLVPIGTVSRELGLSPARIRELTDVGVLTASRTAGGHRRYDLDQVRAAWLRHRMAQAGLADGACVPGAPSLRPQPTTVVVVELAGLEEDQVWRELLPYLGLDQHPVARRVSQYAFTEMLNNAIDHSDGTQATIQVWGSPSALTIEIGDDGIGVLRRLSEGKGLPDLYAAVAELTKGKQTTAPDRHSGEGIFFTSKAVDVFTLESNGIAWIVDNLRQDYAVGSSSTTTGTKVRLDIDPGTVLDLGELFRHFTDDSEFTRTRPVVKLFGLGTTFVSRSEAKRLLTGMEQFSEVELDFTGVDVVGQGFVDEVFRVWPQSHPDTALSPTNMGAAVGFMVRRALPTPVP